jgi:hypothetical protein
MLRQPRELSLIYTYRRAWLALFLADSGLFPAVLWESHFKVRAINYPPWWCVIGVWLPKNGSNPMGWLTDHLLLWWFAVLLLLLGVTTSNQRDGKG